MPPTREPDTAPAGKGASPINTAVAILRCFSVAEPELGVTEIAQRIGLHKSSVSRSLGILEGESLVERNDVTRRYRLGVGLLALAGPLLADLDLGRIAYPHMVDLSRRTEETVALLIWDGAACVAIEQVASPRQVKHTTTLGTRYDEALSASVQVFLAFTEPARIESLIRSTRVSLPGEGDARIADYLDRLGEVARRGWSVNFRDTSVEEAGVAAPIFNQRGEVEAALLISAPAFRTTPALLESFGAMCAEAALEITGRIAGSAPVAAAPTA